MPLDCELSLLPTVISFEGGLVFLVAFFWCSLYYSAVFDAMEKDTFFCVYIYNIFDLQKLYKKKADVFILISHAWLLFGALKLFCLQQKHQFDISMKRAMSFL